MNFFEKIINKVVKKDYADKAQITQVNDTVLIENLPGDQTLALTMEELRGGKLSEIADLLRPEDLAAILLMMQNSQQAVVLAQADGSIPAQVSSLQVLATIAETSGDVTVKRAGQTFVLKVGDSVLAGDEVNAGSKPVTLQLVPRNADAGATVKFSGVVQLGFEIPNPVPTSKILVAVVDGPAAVLG